jgi:hypothetical protein
MNEEFVELVLARGEAGVADYLALEDREVQFDLVDPTHV